MIVLDYHAQFNRNICYILVYISTCAFPILLGYSLALYYQAQHYLLTRGCDHLIGRYRDTRLLYCIYYTKKPPYSNTITTNFRKYLKLIH
jgi:hypothetical protein